MCRRGKTIETEGRFETARDWGRGTGPQCERCRISLAASISSKEVFGATQASVNAPTSSPRSPLVLPPRVENAPSKGSLEGRACVLLPPLPHQDSRTPARSLHD